MKELPKHTVINIRQFRDNKEKYEGLKCFLRLGSDHETVMVMVRNTPSWSNGAGPSIMTVNQLIKLPQFLGWGGNVEVCLVCPPKPERKEGEPPEQTCRMEDVLSATTLKLLESAPENESVRALVLSQIKKPLPPEAKTFAAIKDWVEFNVDSALFPIANPGASAFTVEVDVSESASGRCSWSGSRSGRENYSVMEGDIIELVNAASRRGEKIDTLVRALCELINDSVGDNPPDMVDSGDIEYENYEETDSNGMDIDFSTTMVKANLMAWLAEKHPELLDNIQ